jgi:glycosyltransferase involved in cell wall biosynthesis
MQVLVYGDWKETKNIKPFFTASYSRNEINTTSPRELNPATPLKLLFVGTLHSGKRPMISLEIVKMLKERGLNCVINFFGDGPELMKMKDFCERNFIQDSVYFHGNVNSEVVKKAYQESQFLIFASQSEGWPKVVAESMFWGCLPITTAVSCVPEMVGNGLRGDLVEPKSEAITSRIEYYLTNPNEYYNKCEEAMRWSRQFTLERFEEEIKKLLV